MTAAAPHPHLTALLAALPELQRHGVTEIQVSPEGALTLRLREVHAEPPPVPDDREPPAEGDDLDTAHLDGDAPGEA